MPTVKKVSKDHHQPREHLDLFSLFPGQGRLTFIFARSWEFLILLAWIGRLDANLVNAFSVIQQTFHQTWTCLDNWQILEAASVSQFHSECRVCALTRQTCFTWKLIRFFTSATLKCFMTLVNMADAMFHVVYAVFCLTRISLWQLSGFCGVCPYPTHPFVHDM